MQPVSKSFGQTVVVLVATIVSGTTLMLAALGPGLVPASSAQVAASPRA